MSFPAEFGIASGSDSDEWLVGMVNAGPYLGSSLLGCWLSDPLNSKLLLQVAVRSAFLIFDIQTTSVGEAQSLLQHYALSLRPSLPASPRIGKVSSSHGTWLDMSLDDHLIVAS